MTQLTREGLLRVVVLKTKTPMWDATATKLADAIRLHHLTQVLTGLRHDNRPVSFGRAFEVVYGERLTLERR